VAKNHHILRLTIETPEGVQVRQLDVRGSLKIGYDPGNDIPIEGRGVPKKFTLVTGNRNYYLLWLQKDMQGEIVAGTSRLKIQDLITHELLRRKKGIYYLKITPDKDKYGWITLGPIKVSYRFNGKATVLQPVTPYWKLSRSLFRAMFSDITFKIIFLVLLVVGIAFGYKVNTIKITEPRRINLEQLSRRMARFIIRPQPASGALATKGLGVGKKRESRTEGKSTKSEPKSNKSETSKSTATTSSKPAAKTTVLSKGLLGLIAGTGPAAKSSNIIETLVDKGLVRELDEVLQSGKELEIELPSLTDEVGNLDALFSDQDADVDKLIAGMKVEDHVKLKEKGDVDLKEIGEITGSVAARGWRSEESIRDVILSYMGRITYTYNRFLKKNPDLKGKIVLEMTIAASGEVTSCKIISSTVGDPEFEQAIIAVVQRFKFKPIPEGEITVENPFVFFRRDQQ